MRPKEDTCSADSCTVLRYLVEPERNVTVPVGIVLSSEKTGAVWFRLPREGEVIAGVSLTTAMPYVEMARRQIEGWLQAGTLPYASEPLSPLSAAWWEQVRRLMQWRVRLERTRPIAVRCADTEIEALYEAVERPYPQQRCRLG